MRLIKKDRNPPVFRQLLGFFKRPSPVASVLMDERRPYKRDFDRFPIEFQVGVSFKDKNSENLHDEAELHDISGNGAMFISRCPDRYYPGQALKLTIFLAGTEDVQASVRTEATVMRIHPLEGADEGHVRAGAGIAVRFDTLFEFERMTGPLEGGA